jgi:hypothetical protein
MRVLLCGEGVHEMGEPRIWDQPTKTYVSTEGWMQIVARRAMTKAVEFEVRLRSDLFLDDRMEKKLGPRPKGHGRKAKIARFVAGNEEYDAVVFMVDADSNAKTDWKAVVAEINAGFAALPSVTPAVPCVPMSASESWLLADPVVWAGLGLKSAKTLPAKPEAIWGKPNDPKGNHPHPYMSRVCEAADVPDNLATRRSVATGSDLATLQKKCPLSYASFHAAMAAL